MSAAPPSSPMPKRKPRRGCLRLLFVMLVGGTLLAAVLFILFLRANPNPPLAPWIPPEADAAASVELDFSGEELGGLLRIGLTAEGSTTPQQRDRLLAALDQVVRVALYPRILLVATLDPETLEARWGAVGNLRRGQQLIEPLSKQLLEEDITWSAERLGGRPVQRLHVEMLGLEGVIDDTQLIVASDAQWLESMVDQAQKSPPAPAALGRVTQHDGAMRIAVEDESGALRDVLREFGEMESDPDIAMASRNLFRLLQDTGGSATIDIELRVSEAQAIISPAGGRRFQEQTLQEAAEEVQEYLGLLIGMPNIQVAEIVEHEGKSSLKIYVPAVGILLSGAFE